MSSKSFSPTASLIRSSRLMSMPTPRSQGFADSQFYRSPYPTHQAITTPESSRVRGDWGLKRPIPRKTDNIYLRYNKVDTIEHRTTFESAHDTVITVKKWQEMGIPLKMREQTAGRFTSAFHIDGRPLEPHAQGISETPNSNNAKLQVWGYRDKFVQHMTQGELKAYISDHLVPRRREFEIFAEERLAPQRVTPEAHTTPKTDQIPEGAKISEQGAPEMPHENSHQSIIIATEHTTASPLNNTPSPVGDSILPISDIIKAVRYDPVKIYNLVRDFLQMPLRKVPLPIHPSGGLHYIFDNSYLENHPDNGPTTNREIPARLISKLEGRGFDSNKRRTYYIVGGIVQYAQHEAVNNTIEQSYNVSRIIKVIPLTAEFDHQGKISIELDRIGPSFPYLTLVNNSQKTMYMRKESNAANLESLRSGNNFADGPLVDFNGRSPETPHQMNNQLVSLIHILSDSKR